MFWSRIVDRKRAAARLASVVLEARAQSIAGQLHRADHMRAGNGRCDYCVEEAKRIESDGWDRLEADVMGQVSGPPDQVSPREG